LTGQSRELTLTGFLDAPVKPWHDGKRIEAIESNHEKLVGDALWLPWPGS
jgi:hypothetical protein